MRPCPNLHTLTSSHATTSLSFSLCTHVVALPHRRQKQSPRYCPSNKGEARSPPSLLAATATVAPPRRPAPRNRRVEEPPSHRPEPPGIVAPRSRRHRCRTAFFASRTLCRFHLPRDNTHAASSSRDAVRVIKV